MQVGVLGPVEVEGTPVRGREAAVLAALAVCAPGVASVDQLIDDVWGDDPPLTAPKSLQNAISKLRRVLPADAIETVAGGYRLHAETDVMRVEALARAGRHEEALAEWRGEASALPTRDRIRLAELRSALEDEHLAALVGRGEHAAAVPPLERAVAAEPFRERRWALLTEALAATGRQGDALRAVQRARRVLADELGLEPGPELLAAERAVLALEPSRPVRRRAPVPATSFVGREEEVRLLRSRLDDHRLVTVTGPGGVGKTRVALAVVESLDAVFVDLAPVGSGERVWEAVAAAAAIPSEPGRVVADSVIAALEGTMVLDNCEHVLDAAADVADRVRARILATSREPLGLPEEMVVALAPLAPSDAVALYVDRAGGAQDDAAVRELCDRLDRLPLAIELAAARAPALDAGQVLARLADRFALLDDRARRGQPRHRALRAVVDWSYELLEDDERRLFDRLSVFRAPFSLEDAEAVVTDDALPVGAVAPAMTRLVRASLVTVESRHYRLLETFRAYAEVRLDDPDLWRRRHLEWVVAFAAEAGPQLSGPDQVEWFARVGAILDDVQEALAWCAEHGPASSGLSIASNLFHFWMGRARRSEGLRWLELFATTATDVPALERCRALFGGGLIAMMSDVASVAGVAAIADQVADDRDSRAVADVIAAIVSLWRADAEGADALLTQAMSVIDEPQHARTLPRLWDARTWLASLQGDFAAARRYWAHATRELEAMGDQHLYGSWVSLDGDLAYAMGERDESARGAVEALRIARAVQCRSCESHALGTLALNGPVEEEGGRSAALRRAVSLVAAIGEVSSVISSVRILAATVADDEPPVAARLVGGCEALRERTGMMLLLPGREAYAAPLLADARRRLGAERWDALVAEGRGLSYAELVALAIS